MIDRSSLDALFSLMIEAAGRRLIEELKQQGAGDIAITSGTSSSLRE